MAPTALADADLRVTVFDNDPTRGVSVGLSNDGPDPAANVTFTVRVAGATVQQFEYAGTELSCGSSGDTVTCTSPLFDVSYNGTQVVVLRLAFPAAGPYAVAGQVTSSTADPVPGNNSATAPVAPPAAPTPTPPTVPTPTPPVGVLPAPVQGRTVNAEPVKGIVRVKRPGQRTFTVLQAGEQIPVGSTVDTTKGRMRLTSAAGGTKLNVAEFYDGQFKVAQARGRSLTRLLLTGGNLNACPKPGTRAQDAKKPKKRPGRRLWGSGSGDYQTGGRHSATTVRGTVWLVEDRCDGTLTRVTKGSVTVRDFTARRTVIVRAGKSYLARRP
ncbi:DUF11 domain-containing protein [Miltoncostaea oceani]|uniref:DUF11 domain-containing protein n=1 Tax=Miltoncostaea oceani TaxID=2843216 RepID=UPI001C3CFE4E|nr:DUF11 domain-containing protein [Miltoncostaea oceani]